MRLTKIFAIAGLDGRAIGSKSLISFCSGRTLIIKLQMLSSTKYFQSAFVPGRRSMNTLPSQILERYAPYDLKKWKV